VRALFVIPGRQLNGTARALVEGGLALAAREHTSVIATPAGGEADRFAKYRALETQPIAAQQGIGGRARAIRTLIVRHWIDAIFTANEADMLGAALASRSGKRPVVVRRVGAGEMPERTWRTWLALRLAATGCLTTDASPATASRLAGVAVVDGPLGVRLPDAAAEVGAEPATLRLTCICGTRRGEPGGLGDVLRAFALLRDRFPTLRLVVVGDGDDNGDTSARLHAAALRVSTAVDWIADPLQRPAALRLSTVGIVAADGDDLVYGVLDLMAHGVPFVARGSPLVERYASHGIHGALLPALDPARTASELAVMLASPERRQAMGTASRTRVAREFTDRDFVHPFEQVVRRLQGKGS